MADGTTGTGPAGDPPDSTDGDLPDGVTDTGLQRALGERRRRRMAERSGQVPLDATTSQWPVAEPPAAPRPVVRPARPTLEGVATAPVLPTPSALVVGPLLEARRPTTTGAPGGRRARRLATLGTVDGTPATGPATREPGPAEPVPAEPAGAAAGPPPVDDDDPDWEAQLLAPRGSGARTGGPRGPGHSRPRRHARDDATPRPTPTPTAPREPDGDRPGWSPAAAWQRLRAGRPARPDLLALAGLLLVVLLVVALVVGLAGGGDDAAAVEATPDAPAQQTLALTLGAAGDVDRAALLGADDARLATLLLPRDLQLVVADAGQVPLWQAVTIGPDSLRRGLEDTLGLRVDEVQLLDGTQLAGLVDGVGGVVVDVAQEVVTDDVVVPAGDDQRLAGAQAVVYATTSADGEPPEAGLARFSAVLGALVAAMPSDPDDAVSVLAAAGVTATGAAGDDGADGAASPAARDGVDPGVAEVLAQAAGRAGGGSAEAVVLPTREVTAGDASVRGVDRDAVAGTLGERFAGALLPVSAVGEVQVEVRNGVGTPGLVGAARDLLVQAGLRYVGGTNTPEFGEETTVVLVASQDADDRAMGQAVADAIGVGPEALQINNQDMVDTDVVVVLGEDFAARADPSSATS